ncbi:MAG: DUF6504 family protein [Syntrophobacteraceae bacterium]
MRLEPIEVQTRDGYRTSQEPASFVWRGKVYVVSEVLDRWYEGYLGPRRVPMRVFKVSVGREGVFVLRYHELFASWSILVTGTEVAEDDSV